LNKNLLKILNPKKYPSKRMYYQQPIEVDSVIGACMIVRKEAIEQVGFLDQDYFLFLEETDWCWRMKKAGWKVFHVPNVQIYHLQGGSKNQLPAQAWLEYYRSLYKFFKNHRSWFSLLSLRIFRPLKLSFNLLGICIALSFTLGKKRGIRRKFNIYSQLLLWHLKFCPPDMGIQGLDQKKKVLPVSPQFLNLSRDGIKWKVEKGKEYLLLNNLDFKNLSKDPRCQILKESKIKSLVSVHLDKKNPSSTFFIKVYKCHNLLNKIKYLFRQSKGYRELKIANQIYQREISTIIPLAVGKKRKLGWLDKSYVIMEKKENSLNLENYLLKGNYGENFRLKRKIIQEYGKLARKIHDRGILQDDFDPNNILLQWKRDHHEFQLFLIDFERIRILRKLLRRQKIWSLSKLNRIEGKISRTDRLRFVLAYLGEDTTRDKYKVLLWDLEREWKKVLLWDSRRVARSCVSPGSKIGKLDFKGFRGFYRKKWGTTKKYSEEDIKEIITFLNNPVFLNDKKNKKHLKKGFYPLTFSTNGEEKRFCVKKFSYHSILKAVGINHKRTPGYKKWRTLNSNAKLRMPTPFPVAILEKKASGLSWDGFLITEEIHEGMEIDRLLPKFP
jgi:hypothetical protein